MKVLITGGAGYLGSILTGELLSHGYEVDVVDRLNYGDSGVRPYKHLRNYRFHRFDVRDQYKLGEVVSQVDVVVHLAALVGESLCQDRKRDATSVNVDGTRIVAEQCKKHGKPLVFASTCSNYGVTEDYADEDSPLNPKGLYAETKVAGEKIVSELDDYMILRFATLFGVSPRMRLDLMLNEWTTQLMDEGFIDIYQPEACRPILNVKDAAKTIWRVIGTLPWQTGVTYNVGVNEFNLTKRELAELIKDEVGGEIVYVERGDPRNYKVNFSKLNEILPIADPITPYVGVNLVKKYLNSAPNTSRCYNREGYQ